MLKFKEFIAEGEEADKMAKHGKGTGSKRRKQWDEFIKTGNWAGTPTGQWKECKHNCPTEETVTKRKSGTGEPYQVTQKHGEWKHLLPEGMVCHLPKEHHCGNCLMIPDAGGKIKL